MPAISVVMPVYNAENYLHEAIESILTQSYSDFEFIIINDASTDSSESIILSFNDTRIKYFKNIENKGVVYSLNRGLSVAKGDFIARMDADDISLQERFTAQITYLLNNKDVAACGCSITYIKDGNYIKNWNVPITKQIIELNLLHGPSLAHPTVFFRKKCLDAYNLQYKDEYPHSEDYDLWQRMVMLGCNLHNLENVYLLYRLHSNNVGKVFSQDQNRSAVALQIRMFEFYLKRKLKTYEVGIIRNRNTNLSAMKYIRSCNTLINDFVFATSELNSWNISITYNYLINYFFSDLKFTKMFFFNLIITKSFFFKMRNFFYKNKMNKVFC